MKTAALLLALLPFTAVAQQPKALHPDDLPPVTVSPGVMLKELTGRKAPDTAKSDKNSVAFFRLEPGRASAWSHNKIGEESFFVLKGHGEIRTGTTSQPVRPGSFILIPPQVVRSIKANDDEALEYYAVTAPAWTQEDDVLVEAPKAAKPATK